MSYQVRTDSAIIPLTFSGLAPLELNAWRNPEPDKEADTRSIAIQVEVEKDRHELAVTAEVRRSSQLANCKVKLLATFTSDAEEDLQTLSDEAITRFADEVVTVTLWPYLREHMLRLTGQLGIRAMGLPLTPPRLPFKEALSQASTVVTDSTGRIVP